MMEMAAGKKPKAGRTTDPCRRMYRAKRYRAKKDGIEFTIPFEEIVFPTHCPVLGVPLEYSDGDGPPVARLNSPSFDRIDPEKGYVSGNVLIVSMLANQIKSCGTPLQILQVGHFYADLLHQRQDMK